MAGIYIHIPFCRKACHYCNFHFSTQTKHIEAFTKALIQEIQLQKNYLQTPVETLYFGGGTPSLLNPRDFEAIYKAIQANFRLSSDLEFTVEANPDDLDLEKAKSLKSLGVNRLSIGIQSFQPASLAWMNRAHSVQQSHNALTNVKLAGSENISTDLIYGTPHLSDPDLIADIGWLQHYEVPHISCYALTVEEKTALHALIQKEKMEAVDSAHQARQFEIVVDTLHKNGFEHYEISNFAKPGKRSKHNSNYWNRIPYLGLGPSAHSYNQGSRQWNIANNALYIQSIEKNKVPFEMEKLDLRTQYNEYIMITLRQIEGFSLSYIQQNFGTAYHTHTLETLVPFVQNGQLITTKNGYALSNNAKFFADGIASDFFIV
jgi:oxygen-independent coproporphyrinogen-3 oxidase